MLEKLYEKKTLEFVTVALEFCALMETIAKHTVLSFTDKAVKILPLLYLKATLLPEIENTDENADLELFITEETYEVIRICTADLLGEYDTYLDTFHPDIKFSDTPIAVTVSENLADVYQDLGNFAGQFRQENEDVMRNALYSCKENFRMYWGQKLLNALKALHVVRFNEVDIVD
jgi:DNA-directed RNA polymerase subunit H (RpoH/RPB5)